MENKKNKREAIIDSALEIFGRDGFHKAKVEEIARGANVGKGTIYEYFDSKKDLFYQMVKSMVDRYYNKMLKAVSKDIDPINKLHNLFKLQLESKRFHGNLGYVIHVEAIKSGIGKDLKALYIELRSKQIKLIEEILEEGIEAKLFKKGNTYIAALYFIGGINQFDFELNHIDKGSNKKKLDTEKFINTFLNGVMEQR